MPELVYSDARHGAGEDIERSVRFFAQEGRLLRLNYCSVVAKNECNKGGMQHMSPSCRKALHLQVVRLLAMEFPALLEVNESKRLQCRFGTRACAESETSDCELVEKLEVASKPSASAQALTDISCSTCGRIFRSRSSLQCHVQQRRCFSTRGRWKTEYTAKEACPQEERSDLDLQPE